MNSPSRDINIPLYSSPMFRDNCLLPTTTRPLLIRSMTTSWHHQLGEVLEDRDWHQGDVYWVVCPNAEDSRAQFIRWFQERHTKDALVLNGLYPYVACAGYISRALKNGWTQEFLIVDVQRRGFHPLESYAVISGLREGCLTFRKVVGDELWFKQPRLVILADAYPQVTRLRPLSRWKVYRLDHDNLVSVPIDDS